MSAERKRSIDVNNLTIEQVDNLSSQIGEKVKQITDEAANKINSLLSIYGMSAKIAIAFDTLGNKSEEEQS